jgi:hypothetical protein
MRTAKTRGPQGAFMNLSILVGAGLVLLVWGSLLFGCLNEYSSGRMILPTRKVRIGNSG